MAHPLHHAESSVRRFGGRVSDYIEVHQWFDATKSHYSGFSHRALRHHTLGIFEAEARFGVDIVNSDGRRVPVRFIGEQHVKEDCGGRVPSVQDWLSRIEPARWMAAGHMDDAPREELPPDRHRWRAAVVAGETILGFADWLAYGGLDAAVRPVLDCSTGHLSEPTRGWLADSHAAEAVSSLLEGPHGWLVPVLADALNAAPTDLVAVLRHARACGCDYVLFDSDGPALDALPWRDGGSGEDAP